MLGVLILLCLFFGVITYEQQQPLGKDGAERLLLKISNNFEKPGSVIIAGKNGEDGEVFVSHLENELRKKEWLVEAAISGSPIDLGKALRRAVEKKEKVELLCEQTFSNCH